MGCNCKEMEGFDLVMFKAKSYENKTGNKAAVFVVNKKTPSFTDLKNVFEVKGICCYFTTDGVEHLFIKPIVKSEPVTESDSEPTTTTRKRKTSSKKD